MLWGTGGIRANTLNYQILNERECNHQSWKRSLQSNCRLELWVIFFFFFSSSTLWCIGAIKVLHVSVKVSLPDRLRGEWQACSMCSKREYVCHRQIPKANSRVCAISSALTDGEPSRQPRLGAFHQLGPAGAFVVKLIFRMLQLNFWHTIQKKKKKKESAKQCCHKHYHVLMLVVTHSPHPLIELRAFPNSVSHRRRRRRRRAGNVKKSLRPATNVVHTRSHRQTRPPPAGYCTQTATSASGVLWKGRWTDLELLLELAVEACQHRVGFLVFTDRHLDLPLLFGQQPEREFHPHSSGF